jgi:hypothetical protein
VSHGCIEISRESDEAIDRNAVDAGFVFLNLLEAAIEMIGGVGLALARRERA